MSEQVLRDYLQYIRQLGITYVPLPESRTNGPATHELLAREAGACNRCPLHKTRTQAVFGKGNVAARLMFIGEAPGREEDVRGIPFCGAAGKLLDRIIAAMGLTREQIYISNVVKCRPPGNRNPSPQEMSACRRFIDQEIALVKPEVICLLGRVAFHGLLGTTASIMKHRGTWMEYGDIAVMPTYHPAFLLRQTERTYKKHVWQDMKQIMAKLGLPVPDRAKTT